MQVDVPALPAAQLLACGLRQHGRRGHLWRTRDKQVWLRIREDLGDMLVFTPSVSFEATIMCIEVLERLVDCEGRSFRGPVRYAVCVRMPVRPRGGRPLPTMAKRCELVGPPGRPFALPPILGVPVALSLSLTQHNDNGVTQHFVEAHIDSHFLKKRTLEPRKDLFASDVQHLLPLLHVPSVDAFTGALVSRMVSFIRPSPLLPGGASLGLEPGFFVRDKVGRGIEVDGNVFFDIAVPGRGTRILTLPNPPWYVPLPRDLVLDEVEVRKLANAAMGQQPKGAAA